MKKYIKVKRIDMIARVVRPLAAMATIFFFLMLVGVAGHSDWVTEVGEETWSVWMYIKMTLLGVSGMVFFGYVFNLSDEISYYASRWLRHFNRRF